MLAVGAFAEHARIAPILVFTFMWATLVYDPIACWTWNANGWSFIMGGLDFAGVSNSFPHSYRTLRNSVLMYSLL